ncbi:MAG: selenide, water dikinase SelD [Actinomycetota bacterium]|nr:selenide, water dikinase SelD [Actinomycetota bacterium]
MRRLAKRSGTGDPNLLLGLDTPDDAAAYLIDEQTALVQTVDFFTPVVDDAYAWGAIAVANAMSDVYAMGGKPLLGLNLVGWPKELDLDLLGSVLEGAAEKAAEGGMAIIGGHTVDDPEPKFGVAVTGTVHPAKMTRLSGALPGMVLVLTKPLGSGIISTALKRGRLGNELLEEATRIMAMLNAEAATAMTEVGARAATDVTGFGLLGHLRGMAAASGCSVTVWADEVPILDGVRSLAEQGFVPGGSRNNEKYFGQYVDFDTGVDETTRTILFDAQTSGGLLIAIDDGRREDLLHLLSSGSTPAQAVIGRFEEGNPGRIRVTRRG